ncbi:MAG: hypothetical protein AAF654_15150 [Myxococcota bacterium]
MHFDGLALRRRNQTRLWLEAAVRDAFGRQGLARLDAADWRDADNAPFTWLAELREAWA